MALTRTVSRWGRTTTTVVLAAAVAVSPAVAVAAETPTAAPATAVEPTPEVASPAAPVEELNALADALTGLTATREGGAGTAAAGFTSAGQAYAALAHNPTNGKLYAVSPAADRQGADRLLRINPLSGEVLDLGPLTAASGSEEPKGLVSGTFTNDGTFVLFPDEVTADARVFTLDLAKDDSQAATERAMTPHEIRVSPEAEELGVEKLAAFASMPGKVDPEGKDLYSFAISGGTKPVLYRYNLEDETLYAAHASVAPGVDQAAVTRETPVAAWVKGGDTFVAADAEGATVEVTPTRGSLSAPAISATSRVAPSELAGEMAQSTVEGVAPAAAAAPAGDAEKAEPEAGASDAAAPGASDAGEDGKDESGVEKPAATADLTVRVKDSSGKPLAGATVETVSGRKAVTDSTGRAVLAGLSQAGYSVTVSKDGYEETVFDIDLAKRAEKEVRLERDESDSVPKQIEGVLKELTPLLAALGVPVAAASGASGGSKSTTRTTTTRATTSKSTSTSTPKPTTTAAPASQKAAAATAPRTVSAKASTRNAAAPAAGRAAGKTTSAGAKSAKAASSTTPKTRDGKLADTGTPMTAVISLGVLFILLGAAYVAMGRRRENY